MLERRELRKRRTKRTYLWAAYAEPRAILAVIALRIEREKRFITLIARDMDLPSRWRGLILFLPGTEF